VNEELSQLGWKIITVWECETKDENILMSKLAPLLQLKKV
jgi:G:T-mismatch repair DNA endonuclease (very short patch repair protein)